MQRSTQFREFLALNIGGRVSVCELTDYERGFLRAAEKRGGKWVVRGNYDHPKWDYLVEKGYLDRHSTPPATDTVVYVLTEKGSATLCK